MDLLPGEGWSRIFSEFTIIDRRQSHSSITQEHILIALRDYETTVEASINHQLQ